MNTTLTESWWSLVLRGLLAIAVGVIAFVMPAITIGALVILFGAYALVDGVVGIIGAIRASRAHERWGFLLFEGICGIGAAVVTVFWPPITTIALIYLIAAWAIVTGAVEIAAAVQLRRYITGEWLLALGGVASLLFGFFVALFPLAGAFAIAFAIGVYMFTFGVILIGLGIRLRQWGRRPDAHASMPLRPRQA